MRQFAILTIGASVLCSVIVWGADAEKKGGYDRSIYSSSTSRAVETLLQKTGETQLLKDTWSIETSVEEEFAITHLITGKGDARKKTRFYLFKESGKWIAYATLPTHKDNLYVFRELAVNYLTEKRGKWTGASFADKSWQNKDKKQRVINFVYTEEGKGVPVSLAFTFTKEKGWHITAANK